MPFSRCRQVAVNLHQQAVIGGSGGSALVRALFSAYADSPNPWHAPVRPETSLVPKRRLWSTKPFPAPSMLPDAGGVRPTRARNLTPTACASVRVQQAPRQQVRRLTAREPQASAHRQRSVAARRVTRGETRRAPQPHASRTDPHARAVSGRRRRPGRCRDRRPQQDEGGVSGLTPVTT
jgi:hypothetical protein